MLEKTGLTIRLVEKPMSLKTEVRQGHRNIRTVLDIGTYLGVAFLWVGDGHSTVERWRFCGWMMAIQ